MTEWEWCATFVRDARDQQDYALKRAQEGDLIVARNEARLGEQLWIVAITALIRGAQEPAT